MVGTQWRDTNNNPGSRHGLLLKSSSWLGLPTFFWWSTPLWPHWPLGWFSNTPSTCLGSSAPTISSWLSPSSLAGFRSMSLYPWGLLRPHYETAPRFSNLLILSPYYLSHLTYLNLFFVCIAHFSPEECELRPFTPIFSTPTYGMWQVF